MVARLGGEERVLGYGVEYRLAHPTADERQALAALGELGLAEGRDYQRECAVWGRGPAGERRVVFPDVAWPAQRLALEVHGSIRESPRYRDAIAARDARKADFYRAKGWHLLVVTGRELRQDPVGTRERMRAWLTEHGALGREEEGHGRGE